MVPGQNCPFSLRFWAPFMWLLVRVAAHDKKMLLQCYSKCATCESDIPTTLLGSWPVWDARCLWFNSDLGTMALFPTRYCPSYSILLKGEICHIGPKRECPFLIIPVNCKSPILISCYNYHRYLLYYGLVFFIYWLHLVLFQTSVSINRIGKFLHKETRDPGVVSHHSKDSKE